MNVKNLKYKKIKYISIIIIVLIVITIAFKITSNNEEKKETENQNIEQTQYQDNIRIGVSNFDTINPIITKNKQIININQLIFEPLFELDNKYKIMPCLATEYAKTATTTYIIKVNNNIKWSNGTDFNAKDVKYTINLLKNSNNIYSENVKHISSVDVIDDTTIKISLSQEIPFFEYNLIFPIVSENYYNGEDYFNSKKFPIGTGKYKISTISNNQIILEQNELYRFNENQNKNIKKIDILIYDEIGEVYNSFKLGNIDLMNTSSLVYENYIGTIGYYAKQYKGREYDFLSCNCSDYLMKEKSVRQAINYTIDKENIISTIYDNKYCKSDYVLDFGNYIYKENSASSGCNPEKAKQILLNDGWVYTNNRWRKNGNILSVTITVNASNTRKM